MIQPDDAVVCLGEAAHKSHGPHPSHTHHAGRTTSSPQVSTLPSDVSGTLPSPPPAIRHVTLTEGHMRLK